MREPAETEHPPAELIKHINDIGLKGCRCPWQLRPRTGWGRLRTVANCPHHDPGWQQRHLDETLRHLIPKDYPQGKPTLDAGVIGQLHDMLWPPVDDGG